MNETREIGARRAPADAFAAASDAWQMLSGFFQAARVIPQSQRAAAGSLPLTVVSGFLGAGKTTLLNGLLSAPHGRRLAVLVNDFGRINIDAELVIGRTQDMISLANGCACCSVAGDLAKTIVQLAQREEPPDAIVIEASGLADPRGIAQVALANPALRLDGIVCVVDAETVLAQASDAACAKTLLAQVDSADLLVLNKQDLVGARALGLAREWLAARAPGHPIVDAVNAAVPAEVVLGVASPSTFAGVEWIGHASGFESVSLAHDTPLARARVREFVHGLPSGILRAKGVLWVMEDEHERTVYQRVGARGGFTRAGGWNGSPRWSRLVLIGRAGSLDRASLEKGFADCGTPAAAGHPTGSGKAAFPGGLAMPYNSVDDLPKSQVDQYNEHQKHAFLKAFNNAYREYNGDEHRAFAVAHTAAKNAGERPGPG